MSFVADLVSSLAWPVVIVGTAIVLRKPIGAIVRDRTVQSLELGPGGLKLSMVDRVLKDAAEAIEPAAATSQAGTAQVDREQLLRVVDVSPNAAVLDAFSRVERALSTIVERDTGRRFSARSLAQMAVEQRWLSDAVARSVDELSDLRNAVAHGDGAVTTQQALDYVNLACLLLILLRGDPPRRS